MRSSTDTKLSAKSTSYLPTGRWNRVLYLAPVVVVVLWGAAWIAINAHLARGFVHPLFQSLALSENTIALLLRQRKPVGALAGILVVYTLVDLEPTTLLPVLIALFTVTTASSRRVAVWATVATALLVMAMPLIHGDSIALLEYAVVHLAVIGLVAAAGLSWRYWRSRQLMTTR